MKRVPLSVRYLFRIYCLGILFFTFFRLVFLYKGWHAAEHIPTTTILQTLFMGYRFDTVISGYILALPLVVLTIAEFGRFLSRGILLGVNAFLSLLYTIAFFGCAADIPFFLAYNNRLNITVLNWTDSPKFMIKMIATEWSYLVYFLIFFAVAIVFIILLVRVYRRYVAELRAGKPKPSFLLLPVSLFVMLLLFVGIRGRVEAKSPIMIGTAYFSQYDFANQAGLNPIFSFIHSWLESLKEENKYLHLADDKEAIASVQQYLQVSHSNYNSPIARMVYSDTIPAKYNVVLVLMESMSAGFMRHGDNTQDLTPVLDGLADKGYYFSNFYSAGIHTFNGVFSTLYGFPALLARHSMVGATIPHYTGLPYVMQQNGYETLYFTTHDDQFDNVGGFVTANHINRVISTKDYPEKAVVSALGVPDHFMFDFALPIFDKYHIQHKPFFAAMMTGSNHAPYALPTDIPFSPKHTDVRDGNVEYADWAIGHFIAEAKKHAWYNNTIFVFVADHGALEPNGNAGFGDMPYSLNHIPCIIYSPLLIDAPKVFSQPGGQIDVLPTICGLLRFSYINNTMGVDLLSQNRPYMYFSSDDKVGVADTTSFYIWHTDGREAMYGFNNRQHDILSLQRSKADSMKKYAFSMLQTTEWLLQNNKTGAGK